MILPGSFPVFLDIFISARFLIRPTRHAQHLRHVHISRGKWLSGNNSEYRRIYTVPARRLHTGNIEDFLRTRRGSRRGRREGSGWGGEETRSLSQPLACRYYTTGWISLESDVTLFATNCRWRFSINRGDEAGARLFSSAINYKCGSPWHDIPDRFVSMRNAEYRDFRKWKMPRIKNLDADISFSSKTINILFNSCNPISKISFNHSSFDWLYCNYNYIRS